MALGTSINAQGRPRGGDPQENPRAICMRRGALERQDPGNPYCLPSQSRRAGRLSSTLWNADARVVIFSSLGST